jgi:hypothetical protein
MLQHQHDQCLVTVGLLIVRRSAHAARMSQLRIPSLTPSQPSSSRSRRFDFNDIKVLGWSRLGSNPRLPASLPDRSKAQLFSAACAVLIPIDSCEFDGIDTSHPHNPELCKVLPGFRPFESQRVFVSSCGGG